MSRHHPSTIHICKDTYQHRKHRPRRCAAAKKIQHTRIFHTTTPKARPTITAAAIASILATPCQNTQLMPNRVNLQVTEEATLCLVNQERARNSETPLALNIQLQQAAGSHSDRMISENYFNHISPTGETSLQRVAATGYIPNQQVGYTIGENIAWGTLNLATPRAIVEAWINSPEHLANILESKYCDTAIGIDPAVPTSVSISQPGATYTQEFGVITD